MSALGRTYANSFILCGTAVYVLVGNPFSFMVNDPNRVIARGDGLSMLQCGQQASFTITAPGAQLRDIDVRITGTPSISSLCTASTMCRYTTLRNINV